MKAIGEATPVAFFFWGLPHVRENRCRAECHGRGTLVSLLAHGSIIVEEPIRRVELGLARA